MKKSQEKYPYRLNCPTISVNIASSIGQIYPYHRLCRWPHSLSITFPLLLYLRSTLQQNIPLSP